MKTEKDILDIWRKCPFVYFYDTRGLVPQEVLPEYKDFYDDIIERSKINVEVLDELKLYMFEPFVKGKHITWQQTIIVQAIKDAVNGVGPSNISIKTGHGIGKSNIMSRIVVWFLMCFYMSKIGLTAPDSQTLYDALFSEVGNALSSMEREEVKTMFTKTTDYLRVNGASDERFARCKTGKKENPEALAGLHAENIMLIGEEASGLINEILDGGESNLTGKVNLFILIGNPLRNVGYFFDTFGNPDWRNLHFNGEESPITGDYPQRIANKHGKDSDEYRRRVKGLFPREDILDNKGYIQLVLEKDINEVPELELFGERKILGVDCAGEGKDLTTWVLRDNIKAIIVGSEKISDEQSIAEKTLTIAKHYGVKASDIIIDNFGKGANVGMVLTELGYKPTPIYVGETKTKQGGKKVDIVEEGQKMLNLRSLLFWRVKKWLESGGKLGINENWKEIKVIKYKRTGKDQIQIMGKDEMRKQGIKSPDFADALSMTFYHGVKIIIPKKKKKKVVISNYGDYL